MGHGTEKNYKREIAGWFSGQSIHWWRWLALPCLAVVHPTAWQFQVPNLTEYSCSKFVVIIGLGWFKSHTDGSNVSVRSVTKCGWRRRRVESFMNVNFGRHTLNNVQECF